MTTIVRSSQPMPRRPVALPTSPTSPSQPNWWEAGEDIRWCGWLFLLSGLIDLLWILSYPEYHLKVFGTTFAGWIGWLVKLQHPIIHWSIGWGFVRRRLWAWWGYLLYLVLACASEFVTQMVEGVHATRMTMIGISLLFAGYVIMRRRVFGGRCAS